MFPHEKVDKEGGYLVSERVYSEMNADMYSEKKYSEKNADLYSEKNAVDLFCILKRMRKHIPKKPEIYSGQIYSETCIPKRMQIYSEKNYHPVKQRRERYQERRCNHRAALKFPGVVVKVCVPM